MSILESAINCAVSRKKRLYMRGLAIQISTEYGFDVWLGAGTLHLGIAQRTLDQPQEALALIVPTLAASELLEQSYFAPTFLPGSQRPIVLLGSSTRHGRLSTRH